MVRGGGLSEFVCLRPSKVQGISLFLRGVKIYKIGKRGIRVAELPHPRQGRFQSETLVFLCSPEKLTNKGPPKSKAKTTPKVTIGPTSYSGPERRTLKTAKKQPKKVPSGRASAGETAEKQPDWQPNSRNLAPALCTAPTRHVFRLFFGCYSRSGVWGLCSWSGRS